MRRSGIRFPKEAQTKAQVRVNLILTSAGLRLERFWESRPVRPEDWADCSEGGPATGSRGPISGRSVFFSGDGWSVWSKDCAIGQVTRGGIEGAFLVQVGGTVFSGCLLIPWSRRAGSAWRRRGRARLPSSGKGTERGLRPLRWL